MSLTVPHSHTTHILLLHLPTLSSSLPSCWPLCLNLRVFLKSYFWCNCVSKMSCYLRSVYSPISSISAWFLWVWGWLGLALVVCLLEQVYVQNLHLFLIYVAVLFLVNTWFLNIIAYNPVIMVVGLWLTLAELFFSFALCCKALNVNFVSLSVEWFSKWCYLTYSGDCFIMLHILDIQMNYILVSG